MVCGRGTQSILRARGRWLAWSSGPSTSPLDRPERMRSLALQAIVAYQRYLSPHKGFCCAYRSLTGRLSCSSYAAKAIGRSGVLAGVRLTLRRLRRCSAAYAQAPAKAPRQYRAGPLHGQTGHCDFPLGDCHSADFDGFGDCVANCAPCDCGNPWRRKKDDGHAAARSV